MDVNTLLDFAEELLNMYGYETRRNVGLVGNKITTAPLEKETGTLGEMLPTTKEKEIVYKVDLLAEKRDIERPFGRIVVNYKRSNEPATPADIRILEQVRVLSESYTGMFLTASGFTHDAELTAQQLGSITLMTPEKIEGLLGKAMTKERWWFNAPAYEYRWDYDKFVWKTKWFFEKLMFMNFDCIWIFRKEFTYEPYWKFSYHIAPKKGGEMKDGFFAINALTGELDLWIEVKPEEAIALGKTLKQAYMDSELIHTVENIVPRTKIVKPKLPPGVHYEVHRPVMEKHEAKLAAIQWISYIEEVPPEDVLITARELIYHPWWSFYWFYRPIVKNAWYDTEKYPTKISASYGDVFVPPGLFKAAKRDIIYYYMEKSLLKLLGRDRYVNFMRKVTLGICTLWWNYHLVIKPIYIWMLLLLITAGTVYAFVTASLGLSIVLGILLVLIFMGPGYAFLYLLQDYLKKYPAPAYPHPNITPKEYKSKVKPVEEAKEALKELESLAEKGKLAKSELKEFEAVRKEKIKKLLKKAKKKPSFF